MRHGWDEAKRKENLLKHRFDFVAVPRFDWRFAVVTIDDRTNYGELRETAKGLIGAVLHVLVFTTREDAEGELIWAISLRRANRKEEREYAGEIQP